MLLRSTALRSALPRRIVRHASPVHLGVVPRASLSMTSVLHTDESATASAKPSIGNIAQLRKLLPGTSMIKAREALTATSNDVQGALAWLEKDMQVSGAKKASKVGDRTAKEGGIAVCVVADGAPAVVLAEHDGKANFTPVTLSARAGIVELNCETDFVGRNEIFQQLLHDIAHTVALFPTLAMADDVASGAAASHAQHDVIDIPVGQLLAFPLISQPKTATDAESSASSQISAAANTAPPKTVERAILDVISRLGERVHLARAASIANATIPTPEAPRRSQSNEPRSPLFVASSFTHGGIGGSSSATTAGPHVSAGRVGSLLLTRVQRPSPSSIVTRDDEMSLKALRGLTRSLARQAAGMPTRAIRASGSASAADDAETTLYAQAFFMKLAAASLEGQSETSEQETVQQALMSWGRVWTGKSDDTEPAVQVVSMRRWQLGEPFEGQEEATSPVES